MSDFHSPNTAHEDNPDAAAWHEVIEREATQQVYDRKTKKIAPIVVKYRKCGCVTWDHADD